MYYCLSTLRTNQKRQYKDKKFGFGGQKKRSKMNTRESASDMSAFNPRVNQTKAKKGKQKVMFISYKFVKGVFAINVLSLVISNWNFHDVCQRFL